MSVLRFIHLSDIHFSNRSVSIGFDPDLPIRDAIVRDVGAFCKARGKISAILVTGDIAFSGRAIEYEDAAKFLERVCAAAGCRDRDVLMCPGNHDVDWQVQNANATIIDSHEMIRKPDSWEAKEIELTKRLAQPETAKLLYAPLKAYNDFAARFESAFIPDEQNYAWERDFGLNDGSLLRVRGLNTALLSSATDTEKSLLLGRRAWTLSQHSGIETMVMAHHPPSWLADGSEAERQFDDISRIQLYGHVHDQRTVLGQYWVKIFAGAVNPHRQEPHWKPGYNLIEVQVDQTEAKRFLRVGIHVREWQPSPPLFRPLLSRQQRDFEEVRIPIDPVPESIRAVRPTEPTQANDAEPTPEPVDFRELVYRFFRLGYADKSSIVTSLGLLHEKDSALSDLQRMKAALARARDAGRLDEVLTQITELETRNAGR